VAPLQGGDKAGSGFVNTASGAGEPPHLPDEDLGPLWAHFDGSDVLRQACAPPPLSWCYHACGFMRFILAVACCVTLTAADLAQLRQLEEKQRMFELRDLLDQPTENSAEVQLYRAIIASRFGHEREAVSQFRAVLATNPTRDMERKARYELSSALTRLGECDEAANELAAALRLTPSGEMGRAESENALVFLKSLTGVGAQAVEFGPPAPIQARRNELGLWMVPVESNSQRGEWILDTGASLSTLTESEARRMGVAIRETHGYALGYTQAKNPARLAVAGELRLGSASLHNVVFLVVPDEALRISQQKYPISGILGMPVIRALGCVDFSAQGALTLGCGAKPPQGRQTSSSKDSPPLCKFFTWAIACKWRWIPGATQPSFILRFAML